MSTQIKNTLFRFVTMRAPELLEKEMVDQNFVSHPESNKENTETFDSVFLQAANHIAEGISKRKSLKNAAQTFSTTALKTREALHENGIISKELYDFSVWLTKNRSKVTPEQIFEKAMISNGEGITGPMPRFMPLDNITLNQLWDNLFYQIITYQSGYVRESILTVLVADFFIKNHLSVEQTNTGLQKLAQARVVIPKVLFEKEDTTAKKMELQQQIDALPLVTKELDKELELLFIQQKIESKKISIQELKKAQAIYNNSNRKAYELALKNYEALVATTYANAETVERTITDPVTNQQTTVTEYVNLVIPPFEFEKAPELQPTLLNSKTSQKTVSVVNDLIGSNEFETFDEVIAYLESGIDTATQYLFENTNLSESYVNTNGVILPVTDAVSSPTFSIAASATTGNSPVSIIFSENISHIDIVSATYSITFEDNTTVTSTNFTDSIINNRLYINAFTNNLNYYGKTAFTINGTLTRVDGSKIEFAGVGEIQENILGLQKIIPNDGDVISYDLRGNGKYELKAAISSGDGSGNPDNGDTGSGDSTSTSGNVVDYIPSGFGIKRLGILDYRKVEQEVCCYVPGEVSHIENIMASEYKDRTTRSLQRREETNSSTTEVEREKLTDTTTSNRFEMNQEVSNLLAEDTHFGMNSNFNSNWGFGTGDTATKYGLNVGADFATNTTKEESNSQSVTMAKDVTERALDRIVQKVKEERIVKVTNEFEETNTHGFDNRKNTSHISGVYRWIDKIYRNQVFNYGKRLMYEFMIPEPATFHKLATTITNSSGEILEKPMDPRIAPKEIALLLNNDFDTNYKYWASKYNVSLKETPLKQISLSKSLGYSTVSGAGVESKSDSIKIPEGYVSKKGEIIVSYNAEANGTGDFDVVFGNKGFRKYHFLGRNNILDIPMEGFTEEIAIGFGERNNYTINFSFTIKCDITPEAYDKWKTETFNAIIQAYEQKLEEYNQKLKQLKGEIKGTNSGFYRQIENTVLRKNCIEYLNSFDLTGIGGLSSGINVQDFHVNYDSPELEVYAARVKFFEQAFEWNLMSYNFYPMYWGEKGKWQAKYNVEEFNDPTFRAFLQSGMARVMVTVRPGFEEAVNWYMQTGQIWNGGQVPTINDPLFLSIIDELRETEGKVEETWETRVPTSLTVIQAGSIGLDVQGLPCDEDCADYKLFDSDGQPVLDGSGKQISTNPIIQTNVVLGNNEVVIPPYGGGQVYPSEGQQTEGTNPDSNAVQSEVM